MTSNNLSDRIVKVRRRYIDVLHNVKAYADNELRSVQTHIGNDNFLEFQTSKSLESVLFQAICLSNQLQALQEIEEFPKETEDQTSTLNFDADLSDPPDSQIWSL